MTRRLLLLTALLATMAFGQAGTRITSDQIATSAPTQQTRVTVEQAAKLTPGQLAGNLRLVRVTMTNVDTGEAAQTAIVLGYPPAEWCTPQDPRICP